MAPLHKALEVTVQLEDKDEPSLYGCELDGDWTIGAVPQGGYVFGTIVEACIRHQASSPHVDPVYVSAHFLRATNIGKAEVHVTLVKTGKTLSNLQAELVQQWAYIASPGSSTTLKRDTMREWKSGQRRLALGKERKWTGPAIQVPQEIFRRDEQEHCRSITVIAIFESLQRAGSVFVMNPKWGSFVEVAYSDINPIGEKRTEVPSHLCPLCLNIDTDTFALSPEPVITSQSIGVATSSEGFQGIDGILG
ncbi:hypothetical protein ID866_9422 [Astraeus odoratus]|nr:hypothetical protein ID866_9422 [Astraeus odoratus]